MHPMRRTNGGLAMMLGLAGLLAHLGCHRAGGRTETVPTNDPSYPFALVPPLQLTPEVEAFQTITAVAHVGGDVRRYVFDAVLQKRRDSLLVLGLGPMNTRAFSIEQKEPLIVFERYMRASLPLSPRGVIVDVQRVFFVGVPHDPAKRCEGVLRGEVGGETITEHWVDNALVEKTFFRASKASEGPIVVSYRYPARGASDGRCRSGAEASEIELRNPWFAYELKIENHTFERL